MINLIETFMRPVVKTKKGYRMKKGDPNYLVLNFSVDGWTAYVPKDDKQESIYDVIKSLNLLEQILEVIFMNTTVEKVLI